ncbi:MAG TPA: PhnD/SsuA/transferrin family substrate-binding protein [Gemmataceae bacterium]|nr:PhnD/SsuA/transferrin family substrate-binding protein [Gemmataceae bacterium]
MRPWRWSKAIAILATLGLTLAAVPGRAAENDAQSVRIGLVSSLFRDTSEALMQVIMRPFKSLLETQTGMRGRLISGGDAERLGKRLKEGEVHFGIFHGVEFAWAKAKFPRLKPLLIAVNQQPFLRAHLIVRADSKIKAVDDLKGRAVGLPNLSREHCWLFLERRCAPAGQAPDKFFSRISRTRDACYAIDDVIDGTLQAAVIDDTELSIYRKQYPDFSTKVKSLLTSEAFPCAVIAYYPGTLHEDLLDQFRNGMLAAKETRPGRQMMQLCRITSFEEVPDDFEKMLEDIAKAYPPPAK